MLNNLVQVEGIVTKCSLVRPKLLKAVQYNEKNDDYTSSYFRDNTSLDIGIEISNAENRDANENNMPRVLMPTGSIVANKDASENPLELELGYCQYKDYQIVTLQEMPERSMVGVLPRSIEMILEHDLVDKLKPGDRVQSVGIYRPLPGMSNGHCNSTFRSTFLCNNVSIIGKEVGGVNLTGNEVQKIREISGMPNILDLLGRSLCPSIYGHDFVKKALILQLLGGVERTLENGTHLRGDINVMMVGDPSTAKSQLLRAIMDIAPLAISTTGRGSSGVGLTAAVTIDPETKEKRLEAGAMVLADRGIVCIDEFDKMSENDRVAIHEVMEQQTVTIAKAGMHASLNARSSVLAAANPMYGQYDRTRSPQSNIGLPDSLLSRFDLLFIVLDQLDPAPDRKISSHVIRMHQNRRAGTTVEPEALNRGSKLNLDDATEAAADAPVWQRGGKGAAGSSEKSSVSAEAAERDILSKEFLRKYIHYAKSRIQPVLSEEATESISNEYVKMRAKQSKKNLPITTRSLETIIRLATASAKVRLSKSVDAEDVDVASNLLNFVLFHEFSDNATPSLVAGDSPESGATDGSADSHGKKRHREQAVDEATKSKTGGVSAKQLRYSMDTYEESSDWAEGLEDDVLAKVQSIRSDHRAAALAEDDYNMDVDGAAGDTDRVQRVTGAISALCASGEDSDSVELPALMQTLNGPGTERFGLTEVEKILRQLEEDNRIVFEDGKVYIL
jgi:DNA replication licensing factor MCM3